MKASEPNPKASSELMVPSKEAMAAGIAMYELCFAVKYKPSPDANWSVQLLAENIDTHFQPLRTQLSQAEKTAAELAEALKGAVATIRVWHDGNNPDEETWSLYAEHSPEMKPITSALARYAASKQEAK